MNTLLRHCGPGFFSLAPPGSTLLLLDFMDAASSVISTTDLKEAPRVEAVSVLGENPLFLMFESENTNYVFVKNDFFSKYRFSKKRFSKVKFF